ncbi:MAG: T9SS type A sorting domain-containing protein, partial [Candidatus Zixiibacteriota bacterium]
PYEFVDGNATAGAEYEYLLEGVDLTGGTATFGPTVGRAPGRMAPRAMALYQNRPNPARGVTTITFDVAEAGNASVEVFDLAGRRVRTLYDGPADAGAHEISWNLADDAGRPVPPGVYLYRLESAGETTCRRLVAAY